MGYQWGSIGLGIVQKFGGRWCYNTHSAILLIAHNMNFLQGVTSSEFQMFCFGVLKNLEVYGQENALK